MTLQLFSLESGAAVGWVPWQLEAARFLAPTVTVWAALSALAGLLGERLRKLRTEHMRGHAVVMGLGRKGTKLTQDLLDLGYQVVAIDRNPECPNLATCRRLGAISIVGDGQNRSTLQEVRVDRAAIAVAVCGEDSTNVEIALQVHDLMQRTTQSHRQPTRCLVHVVDIALCDLFRHRHLLNHPSGKLDVQFFNIYASAARQLMHEHLLDHAPVDAEDPKGLQLVVLGFGTMGEALALQVARTAHFANGRKPRVSVIDLNASDHRNAFLTRYPQFPHACEIDFVQGNIDHAKTFSCLREWIDNPDFVSAVAVCLDNEWRSLKTALWLTTTLERDNVPVLLRAPEDCLLGDLVRKERLERAAIAPFIPFGRIADVCCADSILSEHHDALARAIHATYLGIRHAEDSAESDPAMRPWDQLPPSLKEFNHYHADHIQVKLRAIGCRIAPLESSDPADADASLWQEQVNAFSPGEIEVMSRMEHAHYNAERFVEGWRLGPRDMTNKTNPGLVPWEDLPESIRDYDREFVRRIPEYMAKTGMGIFRRRQQTTNENAERVETDIQG